MKKMLAILIAMTTPVMADTGGLQIKGTWSTKDGCETLALLKTNPDEAWKKGFDQAIFLNGNNISGYEWGCEFLHSYTGSGGEEVIVSSCAAEGEYWPELITIKRMDPTGWVMSFKDAKGGKDRLLFPKQCK